MQTPRSIQELNKSVINTEITEKTQRLLNLLNQLSGLLGQIEISTDDLVVWLAPAAPTNITDETQEILGRLWDKCQNIQGGPSIAYLAQLILHKR